MKELKRYKNFFICQCGCLNNGEYYNQAVDAKAYKAKAQGGLECAYFVKKKPSIKTAAMGPTIKGAHTIDEALDTTTVKPLMKVVMNTLHQINK